MHTYLLRILNFPSSQLQQQPSPSPTPPPTRPASASRPSSSLYHSDPRYSPQPHGPGSRRAYLDFLARQTAREESFTVPRADWIVDDETAYSTPVQFEDFLHDDPELYSAPLTGGDDRPVPNVSHRVRDRNCVAGVGAGGGGGSGRPDLAERKTKFFGPLPLRQLLAVLAESIRDIQRHDGSEIDDDQTARYPVPNHRPGERRRTVSVDQVRSALFFYNPADKVRPLVGRVIPEDLPLIAAFSKAEWIRFALSVPVHQFVCPTDVLLVPSRHENLALRQVRTKRPLTTKVCNDPISLSNFPEQKKQTNKEKEENEKRRQKKHIKPTPPSILPTD